MGGATKSLGLIRRAAMPALALVIVGTFGGHAIAGPNGLLAWGGYNRDLEQRREELIRRDLGLVRTDEVIIPLE